MKRAFVLILVLIGGLTAAMGHPTSMEAEELPILEYKAEMVLPGDAIVCVSKSCVGSLCCYIW